MTLQEQISELIKKTESIIQENTALKEQVEGLADLQIQTLASQSVMMEKQLKIKNADEEVAKAAAKIKAAMGIVAAGELVEAESDQDAAEEDFEKVD